MNEIFFNRTSLASVKQKDFINEYDKEINEKFAVNGRGIINEEIIETYEPIEPWIIHSSGAPMNYYAVKDCRFAKVKEKKMLNAYTSLERKLYQIILQMGIPLAFYAQYEAGPNKNYTLDGAYPAIKLGVEADGEIWHNNPKKIEGDKTRDANLARQGWTILRFTDKEIEKQSKDVAMVIKQAVQKLMMAHGLTGSGSSTMI